MRLPGVLIITVLFFSCHLFAQIIKIRVAPDTVNQYPAFYIPKPGDADKIVRVNFNVFQNDSGGANFTDKPEDLARLKQILEWTNNFYRHNQPPSDTIPGVVHIPKTYVQFELNGIFFYKKTALENSLNSYLLLKEINAADTNRMNQLNICFTNGTYGKAAGFAGMPDRNMKADQYVVLLNYYGNGNSGGDYARASSMAHELGHVLGLSHTYYGGGASAHCADSANDPEYLDDVYGPWPGNCPHYPPGDHYPWSTNTALIQNDGRTNNIMGGFQSTSYFSPKQIGILHRSLTIRNTRRYLKR